MKGKRLSAEKIWRRLEKNHRDELSVRRSSTVIIGVDVLYRVNYFVDELHGDSRDDPLCLGEGTLQCAQGHSCFLGRHSREQLGETLGQKSPSHRGQEENHTEASAGRTTESKIVVSGNSVSPFPFFPS